MKSFTCRSLAIGVSLLTASLGFAASDNPQVGTTSSQPPVVFVNGYQFACLNPGSVSAHFGSFASLFEAEGVKTAFYDTCSCERCPIEQHAQNLASLINSLKNPDGTPVSQVDVVTASMGGLILRSYLAGKKTDVRDFAPPADPKVRKAVLIASPNFGLLAPDIDKNLDQMQLGSSFLWYLNTWNQNTDDLRGIDAIAIAGNGGASGMDDGLVPLVSASLSFIEPDERTRILPLCHNIDIPLIVNCPSGAGSVYKPDSATHPVWLIANSFFSGTDQWKTIGTPPSQDPYLSKNGGLLTGLHDANDTEVVLTKVTAQGQTDSTANYALSHTSSVGNDWYEEWMKAQPYLITYKGTTNAQAAFTVAAGGSHALLAKLGPWITQAYPSASALPFRSLAPGMIVSLYGSSLKGSGTPTVSLAGTPATVIYSTDAQVNAILPTGQSGWLPLTLTNSTGKQNFPVVLEPAVPALFSADFTGTGNAAATDAANGIVITASAPAHSGEYIALYGTGLGETTSRGGLDWATIQPAVSVAGSSVPVLYAGRAPGFPGLDQINIQLPQGVHGNVPVIVTSGRRSSNVVTIPVQ